MKQPRGSMNLLSFAVASMAAVACGREENTAQTVASTSVTSANVAVAIPGAETVETAQDSVCRTPDGEAAPWARAPLARRAAVVAAPPRGANAKRKLDEAIAKEVAQDATRLETEEAATEGAQVTTTSATVARAQLAQALPAPSRIGFVNRLPATYELERVRMIVDGAVSYDARAPGSLQVAPGGHVVQVIADYRLSDPVFTYVRGYHVELQSTEVVPSSRAPVAFVATALPTGGVTTPMNRRAALTWRSFPGQ